MQSRILQVGISSAVLVIAVGILGGCATIFTGTEDKVKITTTVPDVRIYIDGLLVGKSPIELTLNRSLMGPRKVLRTEKEGYQQQEFMLERQFNNVALWNTTSITFWGVDALTGSITRYRPDSYHIQMVEQSPTRASLQRHEWQAAFSRYVLVHADRIREDIARGDGEVLVGVTSFFRPPAGPEIRLSLERNRAQLIEAGSEIALLTLLLEILPFPRQAADAIPLPGSARDG